MKWLAVFAGLGVSGAGAATPEEVAAALEFPGAVVVSGNWESSPALTHDGVDALRAVPNAAGVTDPHKLRLTATGPGYLKFWTYASEYNFNVQVSGDFQSSHPLYPEWEEEIVWFPPGEHWVEVQAAALAGTYKLAVDQVSFVASPVIPLADAVGAPGLVWQNDVALPWTGVSRDDLRIAVSPLISNGQSSRIATDVTGPGVVSFGWTTDGSGPVSGKLLVNGVSQNVVMGNSNTQPFSVYVPDEGPVRLEWVATAGSGFPGWLEVNDVEWAPYVETSLAEALDTPSGVIWTTSPEHPFTGRPNPGAKGGTAATTEIARYEETWLEATVDGPGIIDFDLRSSPRGVPWYTPGVVVELYVDGQRSAGFTSVWIAGAGEHRVRWVFKNPSYYAQIMAPVVDDVTWTPVMAAEAGPGWTGPGGNVRAFSNGGKNDAPQVVVGGGPGGQPWVERTVTGPGYLDWDALISFSSSQSQQFMELTVDGVVPFEIEPFDDEREWTRFRLSLPAGTHQVRWTLKGTPPFAAPGTTDFTTGMRLSGVTFTAGDSPLMQALEAPSVAWLETGVEGILVTGDQANDGVDAWRISDAEIHLLNLSENGLRAKGAIRREGEENWKTVGNFAPAGKTVFWAGTSAYGFAEGALPAVLDSVVVESVAETSIAEAVDLANPPNVVTGWAGTISAAEAHDGVDAAWSVLTTGNQTNRMAMTAAVSSKIGFYWKQSGDAKLGLRVNGNIIAAAGAGEDWSRVEVTVKAGDVVEWLHVAPFGLYSWSLPQAWVDEISVTPIGSWGLDQAAAGGSELGLISEWVAPKAWAPVELGDSARGARVLESMARMKTSVTGPATLTFKARCFLSPRFFYPDPYGYGGGGTTGGTLTLGGGVTPVPSMTALTFQIDGNAATSIDQRSDKEWTSCSVFIPAGNHEISWSLSRDLSSLDGRPTASSSLIPVEGWVGDISLKTGRSYYNEWTAERLAASALKAPGDDADGDGASNLEEFAYGTQPGDRASVPGKVYGSLGRFPGNLTMVGVPAPDVTVYSVYALYSNPLVGSVLESSVDLKTWQAVPARTSSTFLPGALPTLDLPGWPTDTTTHQVRSFPVTTELPARYFRVRLTLPEN